MLKKSKNSPIKQFLLRQDRIVGIGNIYASEILFISKVSPLRKCGTITLYEAKILIKNIPKILKAAIKHNGTTFSDFQLEDASTGNFQNFIKVYGRDGQKCKSCRSTITKITQAQRSTYYCHNCQRFSLTLETTRESLLLIPLSACSVCSVVKLL